jgi:hypothetical protein
MLINLKKRQKKMTEENTLKTKIEKTVKIIAKYTEYLKDKNCTDIKIFKAVLNSKLWDLSEYQLKNFDLVNQVLLENCLVINENGKIEQYDPKKHELLYNNYKSYSLA